eukprot:g12772.t1
MGGASLAALLHEAHAAAPATRRHGGTGLPETSKLLAPKLPIVLGTRIHPAGHSCMATTFPEMYRCTEVGYLATGPTELPALASVLIFLLLSVRLLVLCDDGGGNGETPPHAAVGAAAANSIFITVDTTAAAASGAGASSLANPLAALELAYANLCANVTACATTTTTTTTPLFGFVSGNGNATAMAVLSTVTATTTIDLLQAMNDALAGIGAPRNRRLSLQGSTGEAVDHHLRARAMEEAPADVEEWVPASNAAGGRLLSTGGTAGTSSASADSRQTQVLRRTLPSVSFHSMFNVAVPLAVAATSFLFLTAPRMFLPEKLDGKVSSYAALAFLAFVGVPLLYAVNLAVLDGRSGLFGMFDASHPGNLQLSGTGSAEKKSSVIALAELFAYLSGFAEYAFLLLCAHSVLFVRFVLHEKHSSVLQAWFVRTEQGRALNAVRAQIEGAQMLAYSQGKEQAERELHHAQEVELQRLERDLVRLDSPTRRAELAIDQDARQRSAMKDVGGPASPSDLKVGRSDPKMGAAHQQSSSSLHDDPSATAVFNMIAREEEDHLQLHFRGKPPEGAAAEFVGTTGRPVTSTSVPPPSTGSAPPPALLPDQQPEQLQSSKRGGSSKKASSKKSPPSPPSRKLSLFVLFFLSLNLVNQWFPALQAVLSGTHGATSGKDDFTMPRKGILITLFEVTVLLLYFHFLLPFGGSVLTALATRLIKTQNIYRDRIAAEDLRSGLAFQSHDHFNHQEARLLFAKVSCYVNFLLDCVQFVVGRALVLQLSSVYLLLLCALLDGLKNLGEFGGKWNEVQIVFGGGGGGAVWGEASDLPSAETDLTWTRFVLRLLDWFGSASVQLPWSLEVDYRVLALESWDLITTACASLPKGGGERNSTGGNLVLADSVSNVNDDIRSRGHVNSDARTQPLPLSATSARSRTPGGGAAAVGVGKEGAHAAEDPGEPMRSPAPPSSRHAGYTTPGAPPGQEQPGHGTPAGFHQPAPNLAQPQFPRRSDTTVKITFLNVQLKVRSVPKSFELYHKYFYFHHTENLISPELVVNRHGNTGLQTNESHIAASLLSPQRLNFDGNDSQMTSSPAGPLLHPFPTMIGSAAPEQVEQIAEVVREDGARSPTTQMRPDALSEMTSRDVGLLSPTAAFHGGQSSGALRAMVEGTHSTSAPEEAPIAAKVSDGGEGVVLYPPPSASAGAASGDENLAATACGVEVHGTLNLEHLAPGERSSSASSDLEEIGLKIFMREGAHLDQPQASSDEDEGKGKGSGGGNAATQKEDAETQDPQTAAIQLPNQLSGSRTSSRRKSLQIETDGPVMRSPAAAGSRGGHPSNVIAPALPQRSSSPSRRMLVAVGSGAINPETTEYIVGRPIGAGGEGDAYNDYNYLSAATPSAGGQAQGAARPHGHFPAQRNRATLYTDGVLLQALQAEIQGQILLRFRVRQHAKLLASFVFFVFPLLLPYTSAEHSLGKVPSPNYYERSYDHSEYLMRVKSDDGTNSIEGVTAESQLRSPFAKTAFVGALVYFLLDCAEAVVLWVTSPVSSGVAGGKPWEMQAAAYSAVTAQHRGVLAPRNVNEVRKAAKQLQLGMLSFGCFAVILLFHVAWNPFSVYGLKTHVERYTDVLTALAPALEAQGRSGGISDEEKVAHPIVIRSQREGSLCSFSCSPRLSLMNMSLANRHNNKTHMDPYICLDAVSCCKSTKTRMEGPDRLSTTLLEADQPGGIGNLAAARAPEDVEKNENLQGTVITFGTFDLFHLGHLLILERAAQFGDKLIVGVSSDALTLKKKGKKPVFDESTRVQLVQSLKCVAKVFIEHSLEEKREYCVEHGAEVFVMGDDHVGRFDAMLEGVCRCHYLPRTKGVSSTDLEIILQERLNLGGGLDKAQKELLEKSVYDSMIPHGKSTAKFSTTSSTTIVSKSSSNKSSESISKSIESSAGVRSESSRDEIGRVSGEGRVSSGSDEDEQPSPVAAEKKTELTEENLKSWSQARMRRSRESVRNIFPGSPSSLRNEHPGTPSSQQVGDADESRDRAADSKPHGSCDADSTQLTHAARSQPHQSQHTDGKSSGGGSGNFLTACNIAVENLMYFLVYLHDVYYLWIQWMCAPVCKRVPREVRGVTVFTANTVTSRGRNNASLVSP